ncbi:UNVERIFIED_CONTAM: hypothetical protein FKN15_065031 [Acipenser sinensis]
MAHPGVMAFQVLREIEVQMVIQELMVLQDIQGLQANLARLGRTVNEENREQLVQLDHLVLRDLLAVQAHRVLVETRVRLAQLAREASKVIGGSLVLQECQGHLVITESLVLLEALVLWVQLGLLVLLVLLGKMVKVATLDPLAHLVHVAKEEKAVLRDHLVLVGLMVSLAFLVPPVLAVVGLKDQVRKKGKLGTHILLEIRLLKELVVQLRLSPQ